MRDSTPKTGDWSDHEVDMEAFGDKRLGKRLVHLGGNIYPHSYAVKGFP